MPSCGSSLTPHLPEPLPFLLSAHVQELHSVFTLYFLLRSQQWFSKTEPDKTSSPQSLYGQTPFQCPPWPCWNGGPTILIILILHSSGPFGLWSDKARTLLLGPAVLCPFQQGLSLLMDLISCSLQVCALALFHLAFQGDIYIYIILAF